MRRFISNIKSRLNREAEEDIETEDGYVELSHEGEDTSSKVIVRPFTLKEFEDVKEVLGKVEVVNAPKASTHNLIADSEGNTCVVEPGRKNLFSGVNDSKLCVVTNFPLSDYEETTPVVVSGSGSDRYQEVLEKLAKLKYSMTVEQGFQILESVKQDGPEWTTQLSMIYDGKNRKLFYCLDQKFDEIIEYDFQHSM